MNSEQDSDSDRTAVLPFPFHGAHCQPQSSQVTAKYKSGAVHGSSSKGSRRRTGGCERCCTSGRMALEGTAALGSLLAKKTAWPNLVGKTRWWSAAECEPLGVLFCSPVVSRSYRTGGERVSSSDCGPHWCDRGVQRSVLRGSYHGRAEVDFRAR